MTGLFEVEFFARHERRYAFTAETVIARDAAEAIIKATKKATKKVGPRVMRLEGGLFPTTVKVLGWES